MTLEQSPGRIRYIPALDGIRGLLLPGLILGSYPLLVGDRPDLPGWIRHGGLFSLNLQMFFLLSGGLVTTVLVAERQRTGTASLKRFYLRRSRRLGPTLVTALPLMVVAEIAWTGGNSSWPLGPHPVVACLAVATCVGNWALWPVLLRVGLERRVSRTAIHGAFGFAAVVSVALATVLYIRYRGPRIYFATPMQLPTLIAGCALGYELTANPVGRLARLMRRRLVGAAGVVGTVLVSAALADHERSASRGGYLVYTLVACLLVGHCVAVAGEQTIVTRVLAWRPLRVMGQIAYEAYLIQVIVIIAVAHALPDLHVYPMVLLDSAIVGVLSLSFYYLIEQPIRRDGWREFFEAARRPVPAVRGAYARQPFAVAGGLATAAAAIAMVGVVSVTGTGAAPATHGGPVVTAQPGGTFVVPIVSDGPAVGAESQRSKDASVVGPATAGSAATAGQPTGARLSSPVIGEVNPAAGPLVGGTTVTLSGRYLDQVDRVMFGGVPAQTFTIISAGEIWAVAPATTRVGRVPVTVENAGAGASAACVGGCTARFAYLAVPTITGLTPPIGALAGGTSVTIHGTGFAPGVEVYFGSFRLPAVHYVNGSMLRIVAPPERLLKLRESLGTLKQIPVQVTVRTPGGASAAGPISRFTYL